MITHPWKLTPQEAVDLQKSLAWAVRLEPLRRPPRTIAGADISLNRFSETIYAGIIVLSYPELALVDSVCLKDTTSFPYIPGLLSFREVPALLKCFQKLRIRPDIVMLDGAGVAHPRRIGVASHFGLLAGIPTIGCAKSRLTGTYDSGELQMQGETRLLSQDGEHLGYVLQSKKRSNPLFISAGYGITQGEALSFTKESLRSYRLPEPTRRAHNLVNDCRLKDKSPRLFI